MNISEVVGMKGGEIELQTLFEFTQTDVKDGRIHGKTTTTGYVPSFLNLLQEAGYQQDEAFFIGE